MKSAVRLGALAILGAAMLATPARAQDKIGFIYVGPAADSGYNTSMDLGRQYVEKHMPGVTTTAFENIPETAEVERVMERLIASGHKIIFATSYGYLDYCIKVGEKHPDVTILHAGGLKTSKNVGTFWADSDGGMYLAGVAAAHVTKSGKLGFQGGFQIPQLMRSVNAFTLGAQSVNPNITTTVVWNGGWWEPQKETEATNAFADLGVDVIAEQVDSPITIAEAAQKRGIYVIGKDVDIEDRVPKAWVTGVSWNWGPMMVDEIKAIKAGTWKPSNLRGDLASGNVVLDPFGPAVTEDTRKQVLQLKADIISGKKSIWEGPITKQDGTVVVPAGQKLSQDQVETMNFLVKGITGATK